MRILRTNEAFRPVEGPAVLAAGFFDGVHVGHRAVLSRAVLRARETGAEAWALTFDRHPREVFDPAGAPPLLTPPPLRIELLAATGLDGAVLLDFNPAFAARPPDAFADDLCRLFPRLAEVHCGADWRFGARAAGTPALLAETGARRGFAVAVAPDATYEGAPVSSTRIRAAVAAGNLAAAAAMLGRPFLIRETVEGGRRVGSANGVATANFLPKSALLPPVGVYAVSSAIDGREVAGVADLGWRPTFADARPESPALEVHYLDFAGDLYGRTLDVAFHRRLRDERAFASSDALFAQIRKDIAAVREDRP